MNRGIIFLISFLALAILGYPAVGAQKKVWVSTTGAKLKAEKTVSSATIANLPVGTHLTVHALKNRWYQVSAPDGKKGWIYRGKVSSEPPKKEGEEQIPLGTLIGDLTGSNIQADASDTSRSVRGLSPEAEAYADRTGTPEQYKKALDTVISTKTSDTEIEQFLRAGKIGEYAE